MKSRINGFTLIELLITITLLSVLAGIGIASFLNLRNVQILRGQVDVLVSDVRWTMSRSRAQESGLQWGIHFENPTGDGNDFYEIWEGDSYATGTVVRRVLLDSGLSFADPGASSTKEIIFSKNTGLPMSDYDVAISSTRGDEFGEVYITDLGRVTGIVENGLVGFWKFDEETGSAVADSSGEGNDGVFVSTPTWTATSSCKIGGCLSLDDGDRVDISSFMELPDTEITIMGWVKQDTLTNWRRLAGHEWVNDGWLLFSNSSGRLVFGVGQGGSQYNAYKDGAISTGVWTFWAGTYDGSTVRVYVDGVEGGTKNLSGATIDNDGVVQIGNGMDGLIDELRIYNRALSVEEIQTIYDVTK